MLFNICGFLLYNIICCKFVIILDFKGFEINVNKFPLSNLNDDLLYFPTFFNNIFEFICKEDKTFSLCSSNLFFKICKNIIFLLKSLSYKTNFKLLSFK